MPPEAAFAADRPEPPVPPVAPEQSPFPEARGLTGPDIEIDLVEGDFRVLGGAPQLLLTVDGEDHAAVDVEVVDTTGAGDALAAGFLVGGAELGVATAARCCARVGSMP